MSATIKIRNKDKYFQKLNKTVPAINEKLRGALAQSGDEFVDKAQSLAPKDKGNLFRSILWRFTKKTTEGKGSVSPAILLTAGDKWGGPADHAVFVEHGTVHMMRQPFFFPAYRMLKRKIRGRLTRAVNSAIKAAFS